MEATSQATIDAKVDVPLQRLRGDVQEPAHLSRRGSTDGAAAPITPHGRSLHSAWAIVGTRRGRRRRAS